MTAKNLRMKAPALWDAVKLGVKDDLRMQKKIHKFEITEKAADTIAHNAAFLAVSQLIHIISK
jgi:hypothetical protein